LGALTETTILNEFSGGAIGEMIKLTYQARRDRFVSFHRSDGFADLTHFLLLSDVIAKAEQASRAEADVLLIDRLFDSWLCYALSDRGLAVLDEPLLRSIHRSCTQEYLPANAAVVFLEVDVDTALERLKAREDFGVGAPDRERLEEVCRNFEELYASSTVVRVPANREPAKVTAAILDALGLQR
jgi:thymidylate kinase